MLLALLLLGCSGDVQHVRNAKIHEIMPLVRLHYNEDGRQLEARIKFRLGDRGPWLEFGKYDRVYLDGHQLPAALEGIEQSTVYQMKLNAVAFVSSHRLSLDLDLREKIEWQIPMPARVDFHPLRETVLKDEQSVRIGWFTIDVKANEQLTLSSEHVAHGKILPTPIHVKTPLPAQSTEITLPSSEFEFLSGKGELFFFIHKTLTLPSPFCKDSWSVFRTFSAKIPYDLN